MKRIYLDSNVFIAFVKSEIGKPFKLFSQDVEDFFVVCPEKYILVLSDYALYEIKKIIYYDEKIICEILEDLEITIEKIITCDLDHEKKEEFKRKGIHSADALHAALAINSDCDILLTFNKKDFVPVQKLIKIREPNELIF